MKNNILLWSLTSALAGFLFGFDTVVISGAEQTIQKLWGLDADEHGVAVASALYGTVVGSLLGGIPTDRWGRRATLLGIGILYFISAIGTAFAQDVVTFTVARFIGGLGIGVSTVVSPLYIAEIAPANQRGRLAGLFQFNIVFGIVAAFGSNAALSLLGPDAWRWMLGVVAIPSLVYTVLCLSLPESPRWLITHRGDRETAIQVLRQIQPLASDEALDAKVEEIAASAAPRKAGGGFWSAGLSKPITMAFLIAFFNQVSGINAVLYFAPRIFELTGLGTHAAMLTSIGIGFTNLVFTFAGLWLIDRLGRRALLTMGSFGYIASLGLTAWAFFTGHFSIVPACIFLFIAAHAIGSGTVIWVFISEIFPNQHRASGQALGSGTHWVFAALITTIFPTMMQKFDAGWVFAFFCGMMVLQLLWVRLSMPETKGTVLEDVQAGLH